uniref:Peptidase_M1 domain-containing protein n=1 Tax=Elaeophora elaphi TaxID=1147741 RepID=A0A0R3RR88_9BILA
MVKNNLTLLGIYPPTSNSIASRTFHFSVNPETIQKYRKVPLTRLPRTLRPEHYDLQLDFTKVISKEQIFGNISILLESYGNSTAPHEVVFHAAANVHIERIRLHHRGKSVRIETFKREQRARIIRLILQQPLKHGWYALEMQFVTKICEDNNGGVQCYRGMGNDNSPSSRDHRLPIISFTTKFQPSLARTFFPCWDEPIWKATHNITILHSSSITVLTNAAPLRFTQKQRRSFVRTKFRETPPIPSFLLAFAFGPYNSLEKSTRYDVPLTIWTFPEDLVYAKFAANFSPHMFDQLAKEFVTPYPLSKIDFVAAHSFPVSGMENWGLVVFQKEMFLLDSLLESNANMTVDLLAEQYDIEKIITHELVHQWFGNLVTINDWSELWLSEGFASYYVSDFLKKQRPILATNEYFLRLSHLLSRQTSNEKVPLVKSFRTEAEVENAFNPYHLYTKGAVIVKMMRDLVGENNFREGVRRFLKTNAYKSIGRSALWKAMPAYTDHGLENKKLENVIEPWLLNDGMPEVMVSASLTFVNDFFDLDLSRNYDYGSIRLIPRPSDQNRYIIYLRDGNTKGHDAKNSKESVKKMRVKKWTDKASIMSRMKYRRTGKSEENEVTNSKETSSSSSFYAEFISKRRTIKNVQINSKKHKAKRKQIIDGGRPTGRRKKERRHRKISGKRRSAQEKQLWSIPFTYQLSSKTNLFGDSIREFWLQNKTVVFTENKEQTSAALLANVNWKYPYRVNYDIENWKMLAKLLHENHLSIPLYSRIQLLLDSEFYLKQSSVPELYLYILSYLTKENDVGLLLFGLDALYRFLDMFQGSSINSLLLLFLREVTEWLDKVMDDTKTKPELAALWLLDANRLIQFYKLRCAVNLSTCDPEDKVEQWLKSGGLTEGDHYSQTTAICHHLFTRGTKEGYDLVENSLKQFSGKWTTAVQLATCVRSERILKKVASQIIATRNAAVYTAILQNEFTLLYNKKFRALFWREIAAMPLTERKLLFSIETDQTTQVAQILVHSVRSSIELEWLINIVPDWVRHRRSTVQEVVRDFDAFNKTVDGVSEEKRATGGFLASLSFIIIAVLVFGELRNYFYGDEGHYYRFSVDTAFNEHPELELDMIVATPCTNLMAHLTGTASHEFNSVNEFKHDPTRFEFTEKEAMYWNELKKVQRRTKEGTTLFKSLDEMTFVSGRVEEGLKTEAETKQREEAYAIQLERKKNPKQSLDGGTLVLIGNGFNVFHVVASNSEKNEGTACRIHGRMRVNKVKGDSFVVSTGKSLSIDGIFANFGGISNPGNVSHRIERFNFGPRIYGLVTPLAGIEQISETGVDEFRYFLKIVPTRIYHSGLFGGSTLTYQYSVTFMKKTPKKDVHKHATIIIYYEFAATVIEVRRIQSSLLQMLVRLCSAVGGVFATSVVLNSICVRILTVWTSASRRVKKIQSVNSQLKIVQSDVIVDT